MDSVVLTGKRRLEVRPCEKPVLKDGSVLIDVSRSGICGSDIHYFDMGLPLNLVMGHEFCGVVASSSRSDLNVGDRVTALPISPCGTCPSCLSGNPQYCPNTWTDAVGLSLTRPGAFSNRIAVRSDMVLKVPDEVTDNEVAMVEPCAVALHAVHLADIKVGDHVLVIGAGIIGDLCAMFAKMNGASYVSVSETNQKRGAKCVRLGCADEWFDAKDSSFLKNVREKCPHGYDVVLDCSGNSMAVTSALSAVRPNGTVVMVGVSLDAITIPSTLIVMQELVVKGAIAYTVSEFSQCIQMMKEKRIDVLKFVDDVVSLDGVQHAFERLTSGEDDAIKILVDPNYL